MLSATEPVLLVERCDASDPLVGVGGVGDVAGSVQHFHVRCRHELGEFSDDGGEQLGAFDAVCQHQGHGGDRQCGGVDRQRGRVVELVEVGGGVGLERADSAGSRIVVCRWAVASKGTTSAFEIVLEDGDDLTTAVVDELAERVGHLAAGAVGVRG